MCGRFSLYAYRMTPQEFEERFGFTIPEEPEYPPSGGGYNIGPYRNIPVIFTDQEQQTKMGSMFWQLIPGWSKEFKSPYTAFNTKIESLDQKGYKRDLIRHARCLIPANNFFEFLKVETEKVNPKTGRKVKELKRIPFKFELKDESLLTLGGIYSIWRDAEKKSFYSCSIITMPANELVKKVHPRMPFILTREAEKIWLNKTVSDFDFLKELITQFPADDMRCFPVSQAVNNPRNNFPELIKPVEREVL
ncbi:MAG: SOS response-associated peptidase [bacterium]